MVTSRRCREGRYFRKFQGIYVRSQATLAGSAAQSVANRRQYKASRMRLKQQLAMVERIAAFFDTI